MKTTTRTALLTVALAALLAGTLHAQQITGTWQGTLKVGPRDLRIVIKIAQNDDKLAATMYSLDQGGQPIPAGAVTRDGATVKFPIAAVGGGYEGKLSADGNTITGTFTQGSGIPLSLVRATPATEWTIPEPLPALKPMAESAAPGVEVATIKPARPDGQFFITVNRSGLLTTGNTSLHDLIKFAYGVHPKQISGGGSWTESEKFDVTVKADTPGIPNLNQLKLITQKLLADRFQLVFHREKKELTAYAITVSKTGHKLTPNTANPKGLPGFGGGPRGLRGQNASISEFASMLQANILDQPVVDQTGLGDAKFDFMVRWTPDGALAASGAAGAGAGGTPPAAENLDAPPDLFTAFQQQLGLKLEKSKAPVDILVLDKVEKPSAN